MDVVLHLDLTIIFEARLCNDSSLSMSRVGKINDLYGGDFMVGECGRFFFTSCERRERPSERSERVSSATPRNE